MERLRRFLKSDAEVFDTLSAAGDSPALLQRLVMAAKKLAAKWPSLPSDDLRDLLASFLQKIIIQGSHIQVMVRRPDLRDVLEKGNEMIAAKRLTGKKLVDADELICLTIEAKRKRYGGEIHLIVPPNSSMAVRHPRPALIKAVARGHAWYEKILDGKIVDMRSLARETKLTPHYVRNVFACAFLAPDIVKQFWKDVSRSV